MSAACSLVRLASGFFRGNHHDHVRRRERRGGEQNGGQDGGKMFRCKHGKTLSIFERTHQKTKSSAVL
jgi:hypothetical protein